MNIGLGTKEINLFSIHFKKNSTLENIHFYINGSTT